MADYTLKAQKRDEVREELRRGDYLQRYVEQITPISRKAGKSHGRPMYVCPFCGSGTGKGKTGAFSLYEEKGVQKWKCLSCGKGGDIFDLIGAREHMTDFAEQLNRAAEIFGLDIDGYQTRPQAAAEQQLTPESKDFTAFYREARNHIDETDYWQRRGLTRETVERFNLGYCAAWRHPKAAANTPTSARLIIPITPYSYLARAVSPDTPKEYAKQKARCGDKDKNLSYWTFNAQALTTARRPIYIVEGEIDAMSVIQAGGEAVAIGSIANVAAFLRQVDRARPTQPFIISLDNEDKEQVIKAISAIKEGLSERGIMAVEYNVAGDYKDANDALVNSPAAFATQVNDAEAVIAEARREQAAAYLSNSAGAHIDEFINGIAASVDTPPTPTGFDALDIELGDGLYEGLYIIGAISSLGKTTFAMQIADNIAADGRDVLIFSLEMSRAELMAKSISRHTIKRVGADKTGTLRRMHAKTARGITTGAQYNGYSDIEKELIKAAIEDYRAYAGHIFIVEGIGDIGVAQIRKAVSEHIRLTGNKPVVIVDYLQILAPHDPRASDKQNTDKAVLELKRASRDYKIPVIAISSFNRENYKAEANMAAFKESGAIEYGCDVLIGMQLSGMRKNISEEEITQKKQANPREVELVILKNRNGRIGFSVQYKYYAMFNYFKESDDRP